jgi:hypothetical protein
MHVPCAQLPPKDIATGRCSSSSVTGSGGGAYVVKLSYSYTTFDTEDGVMLSSPLTGTDDGKTSVHSTRGSVRKGATAAGADFSVMYLVDLIQRALNTLDKQCLL